ncbi:class I SAM-dependent methyltransferase [Candidatus Fermentibacteria bacterium]|nr:class I SAM-dependent methyltransferase [Candidatus Fermentibacteria bacterium]
MRLWALSALRCVGLDEVEAPCRGHLVLAPEPAATERNEEVLEGALSCAACGAVYPVVAGVAVLLRNPFRFFRSFYPFAKDYLADVGGMSPPFQVWLHTHMLADLESKKDKLFPRPVPYNEQVAHPLNKWLGTYLLTHYFPPVPSGNDLLDSLQTASHDGGPIRLLGDMAQRWSNDSPGLGVDMGCSVGGLTRRIAGLCRQAIGIDLSFEKILTARRTLLGVPCGPPPLRVYREGISFENVPLPPMTAANVDFVVASGTETPLETGSADVITSCNLIDIVNDPFAVLAEKVRVLSPKGVLVVSTPYLDHTAAVTQHLEAGAGDPRKTVLEHLTGFEIVEEHLKVPWLLRGSDRHWDLYLDHCFAARRAAG